MSPLSLLQEMRYVDKPHRTDHSSLPFSPPILAHSYHTIVPRLHSWKTYDRQFLFSLWFVFAGLCQGIAGEGVVLVVVAGWSCLWRLMIRPSL